MRNIPTISSPTAILLGAQLEEVLHKESFESGAEVADRQNYLVQTQIYLLQKNQISWIQRACTLKPSVVQSSTSSVSSASVPGTPHQIWRGEGGSAVCDCLSFIAAACNIWQMVLRFDNYRGKNCCLKGWGRRMVFVARNWDLGSHWNARTCMAITQNTPNYF
jgi:hypothetical protein